MTCAQRKFDNAIKYNNLDTVQHYILNKKGFDKNYANIIKQLILNGARHTCSSIEIVIKYNDFELLKFLVLTAIQRNITYIQLMYVCEDLKIIKYVVSLGLIPTVSDFNDACRKGHIEIVKYFVDSKLILLDKKYPRRINRYYVNYVNYGNIGNQYPLNTALWFNRYDVVEYLLSIGFEPDPYLVNKQKLFMQEILIAYGCYASFEYQKFSKERCLIFLMAYDKENYFDEYELFDIQVIIYIFRLFFSM